MYRTQKDDLIRLLKDQSNDVVYFSREERCFKRKSAERAELYVRGLLPKLKKVFWSSYEYEKPVYSALKKTGSVRGKLGGLYRGDMVHHQLELCTNKGIEAAKIVYDGLHSFTEKAILAMIQWEWRPIIAEMPVYNEATNVATKIDLVCLDKHEDIVLVEWKCGMENYLCKGNAEMDGPFKGLYSNCPLNQAYVQLLFTKLFVERAYRVHIKKAYVVQIHTDGITPFPIPKEMLRIQDFTLAYFEQQLIEQAKDKKALSKRRKNI